MSKNCFSSEPLDFSGASQINITVSKQMKSRKETPLLQHQSNRDSESECISVSEVMSEASGQTTKGPF